ncbi:MAG: SDR family oxidoreductase [Holophagales bacterium]|nr:SDR family oxidoreductase [Holophagales bacterium]
MPDPRTAEAPVALVTAAGRGMGAACAEELHRRGYRLALMSTSSAATTLASRLGGIGFRGSVVAPGALEEMVRETLHTWGRIDAVVCNTGHPAKGELLELSDDDWHAALDLLVLHVVRLTRLVTPAMVEQGGGAWVNISAFGAQEPALAYPLSSALRSALSSFAKLYADRYAKDGIRMNNLLPGFIDSYPMDPALVGQIPMGRYGKVEEVAKTTAFLLSPDAGYITGQNVRVDGSLTRST